MSSDFKWVAYFRRTVLVEYFFARKISQHKFSYVKLSRPVRFYADHQTS